MHTNFRRKLAPTFRKTISPWGTFSYHVSYISKKTHTNNNHSSFFGSRLHHRLTSWHTTTSERSVEKNPKKTCDVGSWQHAPGSHVQRTHQHNSRPRLEDTLNIFLIALKYKYFQRWDFSCLRIQSEVTTKYLSIASNVKNSIIFRWLDQLFSSISLGDHNYKYLHQVFLMDFFQI